MEVTSLVDWFYGRLGDGVEHLQTPEECARSKGPVGSRSK